MSKEGSPKRPKISRKPKDVPGNSKADSVIASSIFSIKNLAWASLSVFLAAGSIYTIDNWQSKNNSNTRADTDKSFEEELENLDKIIAEVESGYLDFGKNLESKVDSIKNKYLRDLIINTFEIAKRNGGNPDKNYIRVMSRHSQSIRNGTFLDKDFPFFFYDIRSPKYMDEHDAKALFKGPVRVMQIRSDFDSKSVIDNLTYLHEIVHVQQDDEIRLSKKTREEYFNQEKSSVNKTARESYAYACGVEAANVYLDGMLEKLFKNTKAVEFSMGADGSPIVEISQEVVDSLVIEISQKLNARGNQKLDIQNLIVLSMLYYSNEGSQNEHLPPMFVKYINDFHLSL